MTDIAASGEIGTEDRHVARHRHGPPRAEFRVYFTIIFVLAIPFAALSWLFEAVTRLHLPDNGPVSRAWSEANVITPILFAA